MLIARFNGGTSLSLGFGDGGSKNLIIFDHFIHFRGHVSRETWISLEPRIGGFIIALRATFHLRLM